MRPDNPKRGLSKSRFTAGLQCHKLLWLKAHEPRAKELQPGIVLQDRFDQGNQVELLARERYPEGVAIEVDYRNRERALAATKASLEAGAPTIFDASFLEHDTFVAVDILHREAQGLRLIEVKSTNSQKEEHIPDVAVQQYVLSAAGIDVVAAEVMHMNKDHAYPDTGDLFTATDVTTPVDAWLAKVPGEIDAQLAMLAGPCPEVSIGPHCYDPRDCPFLERCWPQDPNHIKNFYWVGPKTVGNYLQRGIHWISDLPETEKLKPQQSRQLEAMREDRLIVAPGLADALKPFSGRLGFLDFETIARAVPVWPGMHPWGQAAAQFSYHENRGDGTYSHDAFLAEGPEDARPRLAEAMIAATANADRVLMYTSFEKTQIRNLQNTVPDLAPELKELEHKLIDPHPVVRDYVYHPEFEGSFSLKYILTPLVPDLTYNDLVIIDGLVASVEIARLLFVAGVLSPAQHEKTRQDLLAYCKQDTWATVRLVEVLHGLSG